MISTFLLATLLTASQCSNCFVRLDFECTPQNPNYCATSYECIGMFGSDNLMNFQLEIGDDGKYILSGDLRVYDGAQPEVENEPKR